MQEITNFLIFTYRLYVCTIDFHTASLICFHVCSSLQVDLSTCNQFPQSFQLITPECLSVNCAEPFLPEGPPPVPHVGCDHFVRRPPWKWRGSEITSRCTWGRRRGRKWFELRPWSGLRSSMLGFLADVILGGENNCLSHER